jgi:L-asparagine transporter-like permease
MEKHQLKYLYLTMAVTTTAGSLYSDDFRWSGASVLIATCLMVAFFSREREQDERVEQLKLKAIRLALPGAACAVFGHAVLVRMLINDGTARRLLSAFDLLIIAMLIALGLYHYWRWQDGREAGGRKGNAVNH